MNSRALVLVAAFLCGWPAVTAESTRIFEWDQITEADWAVVEDADRGMRDAVMIFERILVDDEDMLDNNCYYTVYRRIRVLSAEGGRWGDIVAPRIRKSQEIEDIRGRTIHRDGSIFDLKESGFFEIEVLANEGTKVKQQVISLPAVSEDCIVEYSVRYRLGGSPNVWVIQKDIYLLAAEYVWRFCRGKGLRGTEYRDFINEAIPSYVVLHAGDRVAAEKRPSLKGPEELVFTVSQVPAFKSEPFSPPDIALKWQVRHYYGGPEDAAGFWAGRSEDFRENLRLFTSQNERLRTVVDEFSSASTGVQKIDTAYDWLNQNIINTNLDEVAGQVEGNGCVDDVIMHGYGNSLEISSVLYDMLRQMSIGAKMAFTVNRNDNVFVSDARYWQFDRTLVAVPDGSGGYTFYKPGYDYLAPGRLDWYNEGTTALIVGDPDLQFSTVPLSGAGSNRTSWDLSLSMDEYLHLAGTLIERSEGQPARSHRAQLRKSEEAEVTQYLKNRFSDILPALKTDTFAVEHMKDGRRPVTIRCDVEGDFAGRQTRSTLLLKPRDFFGRKENPFAPEERTCDIVFDFAYETVEILNLELPNGWACGVMPSDTTFSNRIGECRISFASSDGSLSIQRVFTLSEPIWETSAYKDVQRLFRARDAFGGIAIAISKR